MIEFNEPKKFKWNILYEVPNKETRRADIIAYGRYYDFIPEKGETVVMDNVIYQTTNKIYDFDKHNIVVGLLKIREVNQL